MEYFLSINRPERRIESNLPFRNLNGTSFALEGHMFDAVEPVAIDPEYKYTATIGAFNLFILRQNSAVRVVNDKFGILNLFYHFTDRELCFSNNYWYLAKRCFTSQAQINYAELRRFIFFIGTNPAHSTFINGINILSPASCVSYDFESDSVSIDKYWAYTPSQTVNDLSVATDQAYHAIDKNFESIRRHFGQHRFLFGNSGGLDSRLVPYFARKHGLPLTGFTVLRKRNRIGIKSGTYAASERIRRHYGFCQHYVPRESTNYTDRLLLDVRNAPATSCNMLDNPFEHLAAFKDHILIYGNPAYLIGQSAWTVARGFDNTVSWNYFFYYLLRAYNLNHARLAELSACIDLDAFMAAADVYRSFFEKHKDLGYLRLFQQLHYGCVDLTAHSGGFESINRTMYSLTLYYPYLDSCSTTWSDSLVGDRVVLKALNQRTNPAMARVHDQDFQYVGKVPYVHSQIDKWQRQLGLRSSGMDLAHVTRQPPFLRFAHDICQRTNPYFEPLGNAELLFAKVIGSPNFSPTFSLNFLKVKKMLDILYYQEFDQLDNPAFAVV